MIYLAIFLLIFIQQVTAESEEKMTTSNDFTPTSDPLSINSDYAIGRNKLDIWINRNNWNKGWHDGWPMEYSSWKENWNGAPHGFRQQSTNQRVYNSAPINNYRHKNFGDISGIYDRNYGLGYGYGFVQNLYPYHNNYGNRHNYVYDFYGQNPSSSNNYNRGGDYRYKSGFGQHYRPNNYNYGKEWNNGR